jgi:hypothetical protein
MNEGMGGGSEDTDPDHRGGDGGGGSGLGMVRDDNGNWVPEGVYDLTHANHESTQTWGLLKAFHSTDNYIFVSVLPIYQ